MKSGGQSVSSATPLLIVARGFLTDPSSCVSQAVVGFIICTAKQGNIATDPARLCCLHCSQGEGLWLRLQVVYSPMTVSSCSEKPCKCLTSVHKRVPVQQILLGFSANQIFVHLGFERHYDGTVQCPRPTKFFVNFVKIESPGSRSSIIAFSIICALSM